MPLVRGKDDRVEWKPTERERENERREAQRLADLHTSLQGAVINYLETGCEQGQDYIILHLVDGRKINMAASAWGEGFADINIFEDGKPPIGLND